MSEQHLSLDAHGSAVVLVDHQPGLLDLVHSLPREVVSSNVGMIARLSERTGVPLLISTTDEREGLLGTSIGAIQEPAPLAYARRVARTGAPDAFTDARFAEAVRATGRQTLIVAGILADVCLWKTAASAVGAGYHVHGIADASGSASELADQPMFARLRALGADVGTIYDPLFEFFSDVTTPEGRVAETIASGHDLFVAA